MGSATRRDPDQRRQQRRRRALAQLSTYLDTAERALAEPRGWAAFLALAARFGQGEFSVTNLLLLSQQHPNATAVADYESWQTLGRQVSKGQRGIGLLATGPEGQDRPVYVFDISQTQPHEHAGPATRQHPPPTGLHALTTALSTLAAEHGIPAPAAGSTLATRVHAAARHLLTHRAAHREAESTAVTYLVLRAHGLDTTGLDPIPPQAPGTDLRPVADRVTGTARTILSPTHTPIRDQTTARGLLTHGRTARTETSALAARSAVTAARTGPRSSGEHTPRGHGPSAGAVESPAASRRDRLAALNTVAAAFYRAQLDTTPQAQHYLRDRIGDRAALPDKFVLGYAPPHWTALCDHLQQHGYTEQDLLEAGLAQHTRTGRVIDRFRDRVLVGLHDEDGRLAGFIGRIRTTDPDDNTPKYLNTPTTDLFDKSRLLFGLCEQRDALAAGAVPVLMEGPFDVLATAALSDTHGRLAPVAPSGTACTPQQAASLAGACHTGRLVLAYDGDPAGQTAALRAAEQLLPLPPQVHTTLLPDGHDPGSWAASHPPQQVVDSYLDETHTRPALSALVDARLDEHRDRCATVEGRVAAMRHAVALLDGQPPEQASREALRIATRLEMDPVTVAEELGEVPKSDHAAARRTRDRASTLTRPSPHLATLARMASPAPHHQSPQTTRATPVPPARTGRDHPDSPERGR